MENKFVLITGATSGLGRALARQCAERQFNLILIDMPGSHSHSLAVEIKSNYKVRAVAFEIDLTDTFETARVVKEIQSNFSIFMLINNAGIGGTSSITNASFEYMDNILSVNIRSLVQLTRMFIPSLIQCGKSYILNVSSMAAFSPIAYKTVYPASKAFISSFSLGLLQELKTEGVSVSVLYPGPMMTNFSVTQRLLSLGRKGKMGLLPTDEIAALAIQKTLQAKSVIVPGIVNELNYQIMKLLPASVKSKIISREIKKELALQAAFI